MKTKMEEAIKVVSELKEVMTESLNQAKERYDNREAKDLRTMIKAVKLVEGTLVMRNEPLTQSAGEAV
tara:strand:- start:222 stop:425 length:204 start_codon:yes stop_codon:yes gene_type:complete